MLSRSAPYLASSSIRTVDSGLVLGVLGCSLFGFYESSSYVEEPVMPLRIFSGQTREFGYILVFVSYLVLDCISYCLHYYFQTPKVSSPLYSSARVFPFNISTFLQLSSMVVI